MAVFDTALQPRGSRPPAPEVGKRAPEFFVDSLAGRASIYELAAHFEKLVLVSLDSYRYHPG